MLDKNTLYVADTENHTILNEIAPFSVELSGKEGAVEENGRFQVAAPTFPIDLPVTIHENSSSLQADLVIYYCEADAESLCLIEQVRLQLPISVDDSSNSDLVLPYSIPNPEGDAPQS